LQEEDYFLFDDPKAEAGVVDAGSLGKHQSHINIEKNAQQGPQPSSQETFSKISIKTKKQKKK
jgi:hypothetical protein